jgi:hypothetical protein
MKTKSVVSAERITATIHSIRDQQVMLDEDLALLYGVPVKALNQAVKRNPERFANDFMFQLTKEELQNLRSQIVTSSYGGRRYLPFAFTEQGVGMLSSVLRSSRAAQVNVAIMRTFVQLRRHAMNVEWLDRKLTALEKKYDGQFKLVFDAIRQLIKSDKHKPTLGFARKEMS